MVEHLPKMHVALGSIPTTTKDNQCCKVYINIKMGKWGMVLHTCKSQYLGVLRQEKQRQSQLGYTAKACQKTGNGVGVASKRRQAKHMPQAYGRTGRSKLVVHCELG